jgi:chaperonin GroEL
MSLFHVNKPKSAPKVMIPSSERLTNEVVDTLSMMASMAGQTLGPGGRQVLIERQEINMKPIVTKDGVTVIKNLGFDDPVRQLILEAARDAAIRTANEAGDGTTTATVLSSAICRSTIEVVKNNPRMSPQRIVREMQRMVPDIIRKIESYRIDVTGENYTNVLTRVATLSANGDAELAAKIIEGNDMVGEEGDMTIVEMSGPSKYVLERISGYTIERGYEESCRTFSNGFINDKTGTMVVLERPVFLLYDGFVNDFMQIYDALQNLYKAMKDEKRTEMNVVIVAHGFSDQALGDLHTNWNHSASTLKAFPMMTPEKAILNWRSTFLYDLQAYTGTPVFNPVDRPLADMNATGVLAISRVKRFECSRFKAMVFADEDETSISIRVEELKEHRKNPESDYELNDLNVRIGKLTSGIVRLNIYGPSAGETREKRDRAEDAWMAIKGAIKHGAVPGGGFVLVKLAAFLQVTANEMKRGARQYAVQILGEALLEPVRLLYRNYGYNNEEIERHIIDMLANEEQTFDISEELFVPKADLLDSLPAVAEAIRNSVSISALLGTIGGIVAFRRDSQTDKEEERLVRQFETAIGERGSLNAGQ